MKPLTQAETDQLLVLLRKLWKDEESEWKSEETQYIARIAKSLFTLITRKNYDESK